MSTFELNPFTSLLDIVGSGGSGPTASITGVAPTDAALGAELVTNGAFTTDLSSWTVGANWAWSSGTALHTAGATATISQNISVITGEEYLVQYSITGTIAGLLGVSVDGVTITSYNTIEIDVPGSYYATFVATSTGSVPLAFTPTSAFNAALDSVSVKRVTPTANAIFTINDSASNPIAVFRGSGTLNNLGIGADSLKNNTTGHDNVGVGENVFSKNVTGYESTGIGSNALASNGAGYAVTAVGFNSLLSNTSGFSNTAVGADTLHSNTGGAYNTVLGHGCMYSNTLGFSNVAIGLNALYQNVTGNYSIAIGSNALSNSTLGQNISIGIDSMVDNTTGIYNIALGQYALLKNTIGIHNCAYGIQTMSENIDGDENTAYGSQALSSSVGASNITAIGRLALGYQTAGDNNVAVGFYAGVTENILNRNLTGSNNTWIGTESGSGNTTQLVNSIAVGYRSHPIASNMAHWGNSSITENRMWGNYVLTSGYGQFESVGINTVPSVDLHVVGSALPSATVIFQGYSDGGLGTQTTLEVRNEIGDKVVSIAGSNLAGAGDYGGVNLHGYATSSENLYSYGDLTWFNDSGEASGDLRMGGVRVYRDGDPYHATYQLYLRDTAGSFITPFTVNYQGTLKLNHMLELASASDPVAANQLAVNISGFLQYHDGTASRSVVNKILLNSGGTIYSQPTINFIEGSNVTIGVTTGSDTVDVTINSSGGGGSGLGHGEVMARVSIGI